MEVEAEEEEEEEEEVVEVVVVVVVVAAEGYLQECHLQAEPHPFKESWEEIHQPNLMGTERKAEPFCLHSPYTEE